jgi:hypothetical protein
MKKLLSLIMLTLLAAVASAQDIQRLSASQNYRLPDLHIIKTATLSPSYSCRTSEEFKKGYEGTALFLSAYSKQRNSPDLLFNGACQSTDDFQAATAGNDLALLADLGVGLSLENISAQDLYSTFWPHKPPFVQETKYVNLVPVKLNHTYAVMLNKSEIRGLFVFTVVGYVPNQRVDLRYVVKNYQVQQTVAASPGFDWGKTNH